MGVFDKIGEKLTSGGQAVATQTKNLTEITRLNSEISKDEKRITEIYQILGQQFYSANKGMANENVQNINGLFENIERNKQQIITIKGIVQCPKCTQELPIKSAFCSSCGTTIEEAPAEVTAEEVPAE